MVISTSMTTKPTVAAGEPVRDLVPASVLSSTELSIVPAYQAVPVARLADTRGDLEAALQVPVGRLTPGAPLVLELSGVAGIPDSGVAAVDLNIAVTAVERTGFVAVYPCAAGNDGTARLNFTNRPELGASAIAVQVLAQVDDNGATCIEASAPAHVIVDTSGFLTEGGPLRPIPATRLFDTRTGVGEVRVAAAKPAVDAPFPVKVTGVAGVPDEGASAVLLSVAAVRGETPGFVSVFPCSDGFQGTANLNHRRSAPVANSVIAPLDENGEVCFYNSASVDLVVDISAWFAGGEAFGALKPNRAADTRDGTGGIPVGSLTPFEPLPITLAGVGGVPTVGVEAVSLNVAAARGDGPGFLAIFPCDEEWNGTASLNFQLGEQISNAALTPIADDGTACVLASRAVDVIIDVNGWVGRESVAVDDSVTILEDAGITQIGVLGNDIGTTSITGVTQPANGSVAISSDGADINYTPPADFCTDGPLLDADPATFTYTAAPGLAVATVSVVVTCIDDPPIAVSDSLVIVEDGSATVVDVLGNDTDVDLGPISIASVTQPAQGTVVNNGSTVGYTPSADACNDGVPADGFTYTLAPGALTAAVSITISCIDDVPVAVDDAFTVAEDASATVFAPLSNDTDIDGGPKFIDAVTQPAGGNVGITNGAQDLSYVPDPDFCNDGSPTDDFTYTLMPGGSTATVSMSVMCSNDLPLAIDDAFTSDNLTPGGPNDRNAIGNTTFKVGVAAGSGPERVISGSLLDNDTDGDDGQSDADTLTVTGTADCDSPAAPMLGTVSVNADGTFTYDPAVGVDGVDCFAYTITDGTSTSTAEATIEVADIVWYVDSSVDTVFSGSGTSADPYSETNEVRSLSGPGDVDESGDIIFLYQGTSDGTPGNAYQNGLAVEDDQQVIGEPAGLTVDGVALILPDPGFPEVTSTAGAGIAVYDGGRLDNIHSIDTGTFPGIQILFGGDIELRDVGHSGSGSSGLYLLNVAGPIVATGAITIGGEGVLASAGILVETTQAAGSVTIANVDIDGVNGDGVRVIGQPASADGAVTISDGTIDGSSGYGVNVVDGNGVVTIDADIGTTLSNTGPVRVFDRKGGDVSFGGSIFDSSDNDLLIGGTNNTGTAVGAVTFTEAVTLQSATGIGGDGTGILLEGTSSVAAANATMAVDFDGPVRVLGKINGSSIRATGDSSWPVGTRTVRFNGGLDIATGFTVALGLFIQSTTVEVIDAPGVAESISTQSGATISSNNGSGTLTLDSVTGSSMVVQHTLPEPIQHLDVGSINMSGGDIVTVFLGGFTNGIDSVRIGSGVITAPNARGLEIRNVDTVDLDLALIDVVSDGPSDAAVVISDTGGDIDVGNLSVGDVGDGLVLDGNSATISFGSIDIGNPGSSPTGHGVTITDSTGAIDLGTGDITAAADDAFVVDGGTSNVTYSGTITNSAAIAVVVEDRAAGTVAFGGRVMHTGTGIGVDASNNAAGSTLRFAGGIDIDSTGVAGLLLTTGTYEIVDPVVGSNTVSTSGGVASVFMNGATIGSSGVTLESVDASGSTDGIVLVSVSGSGSFSVTGNGADGSGGSISANTNGVELTSVTVPVVLTELSIAATSGSGVLADRTTSLTVDGVAVTRWANSFGNAGISSIGFEPGARSVTLQGTDSRNVISNVPSGLNGSGVALTASSGDYDIVIDETDFSSITDGISLKPTGLARFDAVVGDTVATGGGSVTVTGAADAGLTVDVGASSSTLLVDQLSTIGVPGASFDSGIVLTSGLLGQLDAVIEDSLLGATTPHRTNGLFVAPGEGTIRVAARDVTAVSDVFDGMRFAATSSGVLDATIVDSTATGITGASSKGLAVITSSPAANLCLDATNNTFSGVDDGLLIDQEPSSTFDIAGLTGGANAAAVDTFLQAPKNTYSPGNSTFIGTAFGSATCAAPVLP